MSTIKTAISIEKNLFDEVEEFAQRLHLSRSQVFSQAVRHLVEKKQNLELLARLNKAYADTQDEELAHAAEHKKRYSGLTKGAW